MNNRQFIDQLFKNIISLEARNVRLGHGSFITIGFGKDLPIDAGKKYG